jgi:Uncharacterized protein conserved in bacteria (DUF2332)
VATEDPDLAAGTELPGRGGLPGAAELAASTAENYRAFAREAHGRSPAYESLTVSVADDPIVQGFLGLLPLAKRQPNLLFAAARYLLDGPVDIGRLRALVSDRRAELAAVMMARRTQTN